MLRERVRLQLEQRGQGQVLGLEQGLEQKEGPRALAPVGRVRDPALKLRAWEGAVHRLLSSVHLILPALRLWSALLLLLTGRQGQVLERWAAGEQGPALVRLVGVAWRLPPA